jgi:hypothetical protein
MPAILTTGLNRLNLPRLEPFIHNCVEEFFHLMLATPPVESKFVFFAFSLKSIPTIKTSCQPTAK